MSLMPASLTDWLVEKVLDILKVEGVFAILPFSPAIGVGPGHTLGSIRLTCEIKIDKAEGKATWEGSPLDFVDQGAVKVVREVQEQAIRTAMEAAKLSSALSLAGSLVTPAIQDMVIEPLQDMSLIRPLILDPVTPWAQYPNGLNYTTIAYAEAQQNLRKAQDWLPRPV